MPDLDPGVVWAVIVAGAIGTFLIRVSFIQAFGWIDEVPPGLARALKFVPAAVLAALVLPRLVYLDGTLVASPENHRLVAGALAAVVAWRTESMLATLSVGMGALWILTFAVP